MSEVIEIVMTEYEHYTSTGNGAKSLMDIDLYIPDGKYAEIEQAEFRSALYNYQDSSDQPGVTFSAPYWLNFMYDGDAPSGGIVPNNERSIGQMSMTEQGMYIPSIGDDLAPVGGSMNKWKAEGFLSMGGKPWLVKPGQLVLRYGRPCVVQNVAGSSSAYIYDKFSMNGILRLEYSIKNLTNSVSVELASR